MKEKIKVVFIDCEIDKNVELDQVPVLHSIIDLSSIGSFFVKDIKSSYGYPTMGQFLIQSDHNDSGSLYYLKEITVYLEPKSS